MKKELTQLQRIIVAFIYIVLMAIIFLLLGGSLFDINEDTSIWFYSGAILLILGTYVIEPFFTKPTDSIANAISALLALIALTNKNNLVAYTFIFYYVIVIFLISVISIFFKDKPTKIGSIFYWLVKYFGSAKLIFSLIYLSAAYSYFTKNIPMLIFASVFWVCIIFFDIVGITIKKIYGLFSTIKEKGKYEYLGKAIECRGEKQFTIELAKESNFKIKKGGIICLKLNMDYNLAMITDIKRLLYKDVIYINLLYYSENNTIKIKPEEIGIDSIKSVFLNELDAIHIKIDYVSKDIQQLILENDFYLKNNDFIGYVDVGSNINTVNFSIIDDLNLVKEGSIITVDINGESTLFQVINGTIKKEDIDRNNEIGFIQGVARKLGKYDFNTKELNAVKWLPKPYEPIYYYKTDDIDDQELKQFADTSIGRLPGTKMGIPIKDSNSLVTYNTAILGILGIGKSCLAFELIKKLIEKDIKVICIDITDQYYTELIGYISKSQIKNELNQMALDLLNSNCDNHGGPSAPSSWGNLNSYSEYLESEIKSFLESNNKIFILNPDKHNVKKALSNFNIQELTDVSIVEKTKIISQNILDYYKEKGQTDNAKCMIVYEEAHSLIPESNAVSDNGDRTNVNATAKVILQGRKYGLGCLVVTQRTAHVTKSILNQCNTIFALRIFDDTGKTFLENYLGKDYTELLPVLDERHAIVIGKGLRLKQPVVIQLNSKDLFINEE